MKNLLCQKAQHVIKHCQDGSKKELHRCVNRESENYKKTVNESICENCLARQLISEQPAKQPVPSYPKVVKLLGNYYEAVKRWVAAGRPKRDEEEVKKIHTEFCTCRVCHCNCIVKFPFKPYCLTRRCGGYS